MPLLVFPGWLQGFVVFNLRGSTNKFLFNLQFLTNKILAGNLHDFTIRLLVLPVALMIGKHLKLPGNTNNGVMKVSKLYKPIDTT